MGIWKISGLVLIAAYAFNYACAKTLERSAQEQDVQDGVVLSRVKRIISGDELPEAKWPWLVHIKVEASYRTGSWWCFWCGKRRFNSVCGGAIVHRNWVLTAAHCVHSSDSEMQEEIDDDKSMHITFGEVEIDCGFWRWWSHFWARFVSGKVDNLCHVHNEKVIRIDSYSPDQLWANDLALIKVNVNLLADSKTGVLELPPDGTGPEWPPSGAICYTHGWGCTSIDGGTTTTARGAALPIVSHQACQGMYGLDLKRDKHLCAGGEGPSVCNGDSGGPLVCYSNDRQTFYQAGIVSFFTKRSTSTRYSGFARVSTHKAWIENTIANN